MLKRMSEGKASDIRFFIDILFPSSRQGKWNPWNICRTGSYVAWNRVPRNREHRAPFRKGSYGIGLNPMTSWSRKHADSINASYSFLGIPQNGNFAFQICLHGFQTERMKICRDRGWKSRIFFAASNAGKLPLWWYSLHGFGFRAQISVDFGTVLRPPEHNG